MISQNTPRSNSLRIAIFGRRNSGKSSLMNALTGQSVSLVSDVAGTTTDAVSKAMEVPEIGACVFVDTAGMDDEGELGSMRVQKSEQEIERADIAILLLTPSTDYTKEQEWLAKLKKRAITTLIVLNKVDLIDDIDQLCAQLKSLFKEEIHLVSAKSGEGVVSLRKQLAEANPKDEVSILGDLVKRGDTVVLVMPQDSQAPKGRLILPQVQTLRELLDRGCLALSCTPDSLQQMLDTLVTPPKLIITDSQVFKQVAALTPAVSKLTSFSILFAHYKGNIPVFIEGAKALDKLLPTSKVLIVEACTHAPATEDIGRVKIPNMLRKRVGAELQIDVVAGSAFPTDVSVYDLIIHCGACMFNRKHVLNRIAQAQEQGVAITNYGITIAHLQGIIDRVVFPNE